MYNQIINMIGVIGVEWSWRCFYGDFSFISEKIAIAKSILAPRKSP